MMTLYDKEFYTTQMDGSLRSAREIAPIVLDFIKPKSVIDIGCGVGTFLSVFKENGIEDILGIDGDYVDRDMLKISPEYFTALDIEKSFRLDRRFDLVVSLEVAEHIPHTSADTYMDSLVELGPVILFSAAIPFQGGTHHVNEQWPDYWVEHFTRRGYVAVDCVRKKIWENDNVQFWYAQNTFIFVRKNCLDRYPRLRKEYVRSSQSQFSIVHPKQYLMMPINPPRPIKDIPLKTLLSILPRSFNEAIKWKLRKFLDRKGV